MVELLVVVSIIAVLGALLMPALSRIREVANRTKCAANLKTMGAAAQAFAAVHNGRFPMCYRMRDVGTTGYPYYVPFVVPQGVSAAGVPDPLCIDSDPAWWTIYGTSALEWQHFGVTIDTLACPSSLRAPIAQDLTVASGGYQAYPQWGSVIWSNYMYVGGLTTSVMKTAPDNKLPYTDYSVPNWNRAVNVVLNGTVVGVNNTDKGVPGVTVADTDLANKVLAADLVFYSGGRTSNGADPNYGWDVTGRWLINHPTKTRVYDQTLTPALYAEMVDYQNILYADGHVAALTNLDYPNPLNTSVAPLSQQNYSMIQADTTQKIGGYMYWEGSQYLPPPVPPAPLTVGPPTGSGGGPTLNPNTEPPPPNQLPLVTPPSSAGIPNPVYIPGFGG